MGHVYKSILFLGLVLLPLLGIAAPATQTSRKAPPVTALVANFYYQDLAAARQWYVNALGFPVIYVDGWVVIVEAGPGMQIALVDQAKGALKAVKDKGTMLAIETSALQEWYDHVRVIKGIEWYPYNGEDPKHFQHGIRQHGDYEEFRVLDPGGYIIEFYRWKPGHGQ
jgi:catechol 2,3-dioxygenase-like lactoylglutathione lyase family enzyme